MKKIVISLICFLIAFNLKAQWPVTQNLGSSSTLVQVPPYGGLRANLINRTYSDTTSANLGNSDYYGGAMIFTTDCACQWFRDSVRQKWVQLLPSGSGLGSGGWLLNGNSLLPQAFGNIGFGLNVNRGINFLTSGVTRFSLDSTGILPNAGSVKSLGIDSISGKLSYASGGSSGITTASNGLSVVGNDVRLGGDMTTSTAVNGSGNTLEWNNFGSFQISSQNGDQFTIQNDQVSVASKEIIFQGISSSSNRNSTISVYEDSIHIEPSLGNLKIDTLNAQSNASDSMLVWTASGANRGKVGYRAIPSSSFSLTNGSGTTANGTAVDLGGVLSFNSTLYNQRNYSFSVQDNSGDEQEYFGVYPAAAYNGTKLSINDNSQSVDITAASAINLNSKGAATYIGDIDGNFNNTLAIINDAAQTVTIPNGNVGIGTSSPDVRLTILGGVRAYEGAETVLSINAGASYSMGSYGVGNGTFLKLSDEDGYSFLDNIAHTQKLGINTATPSNALSVVGSADISQVLQLGALTFSTLPASPSAGMIARITDSDTDTWGATISGSGSITVLAFFNGSNWTCFAK